MACAGYAMHMGVVLKEERQSNQHSYRPGNLQVATTINGPSLQGLTLALITRPRAPGDLPSADLHLQVSTTERARGRR